MMCPLYLTQTVHLNFYLLSPIKREILHTSSSAICAFFCFVKRQTTSRSDTDQSFSLFAGIQDFLQFSHFNIFFGILSFFGVCWLSASAISWLDTKCYTCHRLSNHTQKYWNMFINHWELFGLVWSNYGIFRKTLQTLEGFHTSPINGRHSDECSACITKDAHIRYGQIRFISHLEQ